MQRYVHADAIARFLSVRPSADAKFALQTDAVYTHRRQNGRVGTRVSVFNATMLFDVFQMAISYISENIYVK